MPQEVVVVMGKSTLLDLNTPNGLYELSAIIIFPLKIRKVNREKRRAHPATELLSCDLRLQCLEELRLLRRPSLSGAVESQGEEEKGVVVAGYLKDSEVVSVPREYSVMVLSIHWRRWRHTPLRRVYTGTTAV